MTNAIQDTVRTLLARVCAVDPAAVTEDGLLAGYGMDSVRAVDFMVELEQTYGIQVPDEDIAKIRTLRDVTAYITKKTGTRTP